MPPSSLCGSDDFQIIASSQHNTFDDIIRSSCIVNVGSNLRSSRAKGQTVVRACVVVVLYLWATSPLFCVGECDDCAVLVDGKASELCP